VLRLTAKNTVSLGTYVPSDVEELGSAYSIRSGERGSLRREAAAAFRRMVSAAAADGVTIRIVSGYRSCWTQRDLFNAYVAQYGLHEAERFSARPGQSEHQLGLAADISSPSVGYSLTQTFGDTDEGTWLHWNAWNFGFVLSYPADGESVTGYRYEPWHWRYVGGWKQARRFNASGLTLYEWLLTQGN
jgi:D-alanyl-D-alanine carboxypeptidase